mgnify:CR=1 FL=1
MVGIEIYANKKGNSENVSYKTIQSRITGLTQSISGTELVLPSSFSGTTGNGRTPRNGALVSANITPAISSVIGRKGRHLSGTFCVTGDTMEGIIQCLVFLKAFSVSK